MSYHCLQKPTLSRPLLRGSAKQHLWFCFSYVVPLSATGVLTCRLLSMREIVHLQTGQVYFLHLSLLFAFAEVFFYPLDSAVTKLVGVVFIHLVRSANLLFPPFQVPNSGKLSLTSTALTTMASTREITIFSWSASTFTTMRSDLTNTFLVPS